LKANFVAITRWALCSTLAGIFIIAISGCDDWVSLFFEDVQGSAGEKVPPMEDRQHLPAGGTSPIAYSTDPPTSGPHVEQIPEFKIHSQPITKELAVHGLEDAGVIINYIPDLDNLSVDKLASIASSYHELSGGRSRVIMAPYPNLSHPIVLTAWGRIDRLDSIDEARIRLFIDEYAGIDHHEGSEGRRIP
jgi:hypothetical protein